jgi:cytochrome c5
MKRLLISFTCLILFCCGLFADGPSSKSSSSSSTEATSKTEASRLEGERRYSANCSRCHQAPHKLSPGMMKTAIRHMRVRANITDEDMKLILDYMTQ